MSKYIPRDITLEFMIWRMEYLPGHENKTPIAHYKMIDYYADVEEDGFGMIQCHRGLGKTQLGMEFSLFCVCEGYEKYVLFVGGTQDLANDIVGSAAQLAMDIPNIKVVRSVEGILEIKNKHGDMAYLVAKSTGSKLRGIAKGKIRQRPTALVLDDVVSDDLVLNRLRMARANSWFTSSLLPTLVPGGKVFGSGTPMNQADPFMTLCNNFGSFKIPLSKSSFPDRFSEKWIEKKRKQYEKLGQSLDFKREFQLILADKETQIFEMSKVKFIKEDEIPEDLTWHCALDGAFSEKETADKSAFAIVGIDKHGSWYLYPVSTRENIPELCDRLFGLQSRFRFENIGIEKGSFQLALKPEIDRRRVEYQQYFNVELLSTNGSKLARIKALTPVVNSGRLTIIDNGDSAEELVEQMELTTNDGVASSHDDIIDAACQLVQMNLYYSEGNVAPTRNDYLRDLALSSDEDDEDDDDYGGAVFSV